MHKMVYPENFESKIKFDKIRQFVQKNCLSDMGRDLVEAMKFSTEPTEIRERLEETQEFMSILEEEVFALCRSIQWHRVQSSRTRTALCSRQQA